MQDKVQIHDKEFKLMITDLEIKTRVRELGRELSKAYRDKDVVFIALLNGSFIFAADLVRACDFDMETRLIRTSSYNGMTSTGQVKIDSIEGLLVKGRHVVIIEDIIDTGNTLSAFIQKIQADQPASIAVASLLLKPDALGKTVPLDYIGFRIPNDFVIGYGLDYNERGRTLAGIYQLAE